MLPPVFVPSVVGSIEKKNVSSKIISEIGIMRSRQGDVIGGVWKILEIDGSGTIVLKEIWGLQQVNCCDRSL